MDLGNSMLMKLRRFSAGFDVTARGVTLVVLSRRLQAARPVRIEWLARASLAPGAVAGVEILDRTAVARALADVIGTLPDSCTKSSLHCAMALPASVTLEARVPLASLGAAHLAADPRGLDAALEPLVLAEAERVAGIERNELAVDWSLDETFARERYVRLAASARQHIEARIECAAAAGITLRTIDGEAHAALRAMQHAAALELQPGEPWSALWVGPDGLHGWYVVDDRIVREMRYPSLEYGDLVEALHDLTRGEQSGCALVSGELRILRETSLSLADIGDALGCAVLPFECATLADGTGALTTTLLHEPACAVAFGLALRGVSE